MATSKTLAQLGIRDPDRLATLTRAALQPMQARSNAHQTGKEQTQDRRTEKRLHYPRRFLEDRESIAVASTTKI